MITVDIGFLKASEGVDKWLLEYGKSHNIPVYRWETDNGVIKYELSVCEDNDVPAWFHDIGDKLDGFLTYGLLEDFTLTCRRIEWMHLERRTSKPGSRIP